MKTIIIAAVLISLIPTVALAQRDHDRGDHRYQHQEYRKEYRNHRSNRINGWHVLAGAMIGGIVINEINKNNTIIESQPIMPMRRVLLCSDTIAYDYFGRAVIRKECRYDWVPLN